jgi:hypothetical protein
MTCIDFRRRCIGAPGRGTGLALAIAGSLLAASPSWGFDTGPHADITRDALEAETFGNTAVQVVQVNNWYVDLYENASKLPHSGHAEWWRNLLGSGTWDSENWPKDLVDAADSRHFDSTAGGYPNTASLDAEWTRLQGVVYKLSREAAAANDPLKLLTVLGISLHQVQDFYAHTNWVEPKGTASFDGPGWMAQGYGEAPTWFDVSAEARNRENLYTGGAPGIRRGHGDWRADNNQNLLSAMNKDWPGRPLYPQAHAAAYYATRQWVRSVRRLVANEAFWTRVRTYADRRGTELDHEQKGMVEMSVYAGHWQGQGEPLGASSPGPTGSLIDLRQATVRYFENRGKTLFRRTFEDMVRRVSDPNPPEAVTPVASSLPLQQSHHFVRLQIEYLAEVDDLDLGPVDQADFKVFAKIAGQSYRSPMLNGFDRFTFARPNYPFTWLRALPRTGNFPEQLCNLRIEVTTADALFAGTDDDVSFRINDTTLFKLDKPLYNDFERGDRDTYSCPLDGRALSIGDIRYIQIEKAPDGPGGGWKLQGIKVTANGRVIYQNDRINQWLEDNKRVFRAADFQPAGGTFGREVPIEISLYDEDSLIRGADDHCDINPDFARKDLRLLYDTTNGAFRGDLVGRYTAEAVGDDQFGGRLLDDNSRARLRFRLGTYVPQTPR